MEQQPLEPALSRAVAMSTLSLPAPGDRRDCHCLYPPPDTSGASQVLEMLVFPSLFPVFGKLRSGSGRRTDLQLYWSIRVLGL